GCEGDRDLRELGRPRLELLARLPRRQATDVDAVDADARGNAARRAGEDESEHGAAHDRDNPQHGQTLQEQLPGSAGAPGAGPDRTSPCLDAQRLGSVPMGSEGVQKVNRSMPPATGIAAPVTYEARSEQRKVITFATSSGSPVRLSAVRL